MKQISFPGINVNLKLSNVAFKIFGIEIYWYAIIIVSAIIIALLICKKRDNLYGIKFETILDMVIYIIPISIISARLYYVIFNLEYYIANPSQILNFRTGGLAIYGAIIGGLITAIILSKKYKIDILDFLDYIVPALAIAQSIGRWGNFVNVEAYGSKTQMPWRMGIIEAGKYIEVHPTFLYESICTLIIFIILIKIKDKRKFKGEPTCIYLILYGTVRAIIESLRTDSLMLGKFRISQVLSIIIAVITIGIYYTKMSKNKLKKKKTEKNKNK